ncbi:MotA/TolQ/ExbB proton channel family protein [bacterium]|nr:MotA/TolQ/ExbB proton channel family protein [bacterium]
MSLWTIFAEASIINQAILLFLLLLSILSWTVILNRWNYFRKSRIADDKFHRAMKERELTPEIAKKVLKGGVNSPSARLFVDAENVVWKASKETPETWLEALDMQRDTLKSEGERGLPILAIVASASPFIGLLGTVWGVMLAFLQLGGMQGQPALEVVGPGIAEALIATAAGLFAAIPATVAYNAFIASQRNLLRRSDEFVRQFVFAMQYNR